MTLDKPKVIGIVGGMGPQSGLALYERLIRNTSAVTDQDHLSVILMSFSQDIVDRTLFLEGHTKTNPAYEIARVIHKLSHAGAEVIGIACNTSHAASIFDVITMEVNNGERPVKILHMPREVCTHIRRKYNTGARIGLMATNGTYKSDLYTRMLQNLGFEVVLPDYAFQNEVIHRMIYDPGFGIKANARITGAARALCRKALRFFRIQQTDAIVLGCTELSLILQADEVDGMEIIDSVECFAKALIREAYIETDVHYSIIQP